MIVSSSLNVAAWDLCSEASKTIFKALYALSVTCVIVSYTRGEKIGNKNAFKFLKIQGKGADVRWRARARPDSRSSLSGLRLAIYATQEEPTALFAGWARPRGTAHNVRPVGGINRTVAWRASERTQSTSERRSTESGRASATRQSDTHTSPGIRQTPFWHNTLQSCTVHTAPFRTSSKILRDEA